MLRLGWTTGFAVMMMALVTGCGGGQSSSSEVSATVKAYLSSLASGNATRACDQIAGIEVQALERDASRVGAATCVQAINYVSQSLGGDEKQELRNAKVIDVHVSGNTATAKVQGGTSTARLTKTDGHWYISGGLGS